MISASALGWMAAGFLIGNILVTIACILWFAVRNGTLGRSEDGA